MELFQAVVGNVEGLLQPGQQLTQYRREIGSGQYTVPRGIAVHCRNKTNGTERYTVLNGAMQPLIGQHGVKRRLVPWMSVMLLADHCQVLLTPKGGIYFISRILVEECIIPLYVIP